MGMFDELRCEVPLPDGREARDVYFQTKTFPQPCMHRYVITRAGRLLDSAGNDIEPDGYITFYATADDDGHESPAPDRGRRLRTYRARFSAGQLQGIVRVEDTTDRVHYGLASFRWFDTPSHLFGEPEES